ncbi:hypothetical protein DEQ92_10350 [Haloferax sp. Atlit-6N]|uniref:hypothetical protein n=1 Tax=Haloferax sp. Atlit-6N TaxID=2077205 RepID=UPI000E255585|nr:hypothetical protein [Haloferax sp. Atlit-6N]REA03489.1 hypothetical protein DEQ92_10175 [Haloferax sp. Atlit-6N]REA03517.1 hypothetical protein DEQ92_10350 [Haloferax sp. Atlit-6N]
MTDKNPKSNDTDPLEPDEPELFANTRTKLDEESEDHKIARKAGDASGGLVYNFFRGWWVFWVSFWLKVLRFVPRTNKLGDKVIDAGYKLKLKTTGADTITHVIYGDGVIAPRASSWHTTENEFRSENDERFKTDEQGIPYRMLGKYPVAWALGKYAETTDPIEAFMGGQRRRGEFEPTATTDGGTDVAIHAEVADDEYDGRVISFRDGYRLFGSKVTQEDMSLQGTRAKLAELDWSRKEQLYLVLVGLGGVALGLFGPALAASIAGSASGTGGGINVLPFMINAGLGGVF